MNLTLQIAGGFLAATAIAIWLVTAASRSINTHYDQQTAIQLQQAAARADTAAALDKLRKEIIDRELAAQRVKGEAYAKTPAAIELKRLETDDINALKHTP